MTTFDASIEDQGLMSAEYQRGKPDANVKGDTNHICCFCLDWCQENSHCSNRYYGYVEPEEVGGIGVYWCDDCQDDLEIECEDYIRFRRRNGEWDGMQIDQVDRING